MCDIIEIEFWLYKFFHFIISNLILLIIICGILIFKIPFKVNLKFKRFKKNLFFSIVLFVLLLIFFELILSAGGYFYFYIYSNLDNPKVEEDTFRILSLGESTTHGAFLNGPAEAYSAQLESLLQIKYPNKKIRVYNKGIPSIETTAILRNLDRNMIKYKPDLVIIMATWNDNPILDNSTSSFRPLYSNFRIYCLANFIKDILKLQSQARELWGKEDNDFIYTGGQFYASYKPIIYLSDVIFNFNMIIEKIHSYGSEIYFVGYIQPDAREKVNPILQKVADDNNITYIGNYPLVDFEFNRSLFSEDGWHPSKDGHRIIAEEIAKIIIKEEVI